MNMMLHQRKKALVDCGDNGGICGDIWRVVLNSMSMSQAFPDKNLARYVFLLNS
jgi:hypothetical protein